MSFLAVGQFVFSKQDNSLGMIVGNRVDGDSKLYQFLPQGGKSPVVERLESVLVPAISVKNLMFGWEQAAISVVQGILSGIGASIWNRVANEGSDVLELNLENLRNTIVNEIKRQAINSAFAKYQTAKVLVSRYLNEREGRTLNDAEVLSGESMFFLESLGLEGFHVWQLCSHLQLAILQERLNNAANRDGPIRNIKDHVSYCENHFSRVRDYLCSTFKYCRHIIDGQVCYFYDGLDDDIHLPSSDLLNWVGYIAIYDGSLEKIKGVYPI